MKNDMKAFIKKRDNKEYNFINNFNESQFKRLVLGVMYFE